MAEGRAGSQQHMPDGHNPYELTFAQGEAAADGDSTYTCKTSPFNASRGDKALKIQPGWIFLNSGPFAPCRPWLWPPIHGEGL